MNLLRFIASPCFQVSLFNVQFSIQSSKIIELINVTCVIEKKKHTLIIQSINTHPYNCLGEKIPVFYAIDI